MSKHCDLSPCGTTCFTPSIWTCLKDTDDISPQSRTQVRTLFHLLYQVKSAVNHIFHKTSDRINDQLLLFVYQLSTKEVLCNHLFHLPYHFLLQSNSNFYLSSRPNKNGLFAKKRHCYCLCFFRNAKWRRCNSLKAYATVFSQTFSQS